MELPPFKVRRRRWSMRTAVYVGYTTIVLRNLPSHHTVKTCGVIRASVPPWRPHIVALASVRSHQHPRSLPRLGPPSWSAHDGTGGSFSFLHPLGIGVYHHTLHDSLFRDPLRLPIMQPQRRRDPTPLPNAEACCLCQDVGEHHIRHGGHVIRERATHLLDRQYSA